MMESSSNNRKKVGGFLVYQRRRKGTKSGKISNPQENISSPSESCLAKTDGELKDAIGEGTIIWNGPMGVLEFAKLAVGTEAIAMKLAELSVKEEDTAIVGGEDSVAAVEKAGLADKISHSSSGADASSELIEEKSVPGVLALNDAEQK